MKYAINTYDLLHTLEETGTADIQAVAYPAQPRMAKGIPNNKRR